jgi:hypothetical protein
MNRIFLSATALAALALSPGRATAAEPKGKAAAVEREPGVVWEHTVSMEMAGFSMPGQTSRICKPRKDWNEPPGSGRDDDKCKVTDVRRSGDTMTWKVACEGKEKMTGEGEMTWKGDSYVGKMTMHSADGDMLMRMKGRQTSEECDAGEVKRQVAAIQAQAAESQAKGAAVACDVAVQSMNASYFAGASPPCRDASKKAEMCARLSTRGGYAQAGYLPAPQQAELAQACGRPLASYLGELCKKAYEEEAAWKEAAAKKSKDDGDPLAFIRKHCPAEAKAIVERECGGQDFTPGLYRYQELCSQYGIDLAAESAKRKAAKKGQAPAAPPPAKADPATDAAKKAVKGLFGF